jgi:Family of unknown function (DUF6537)
MRRLRGTWLDPFGHTEVRCTERALITEYRKVVDTLLTGLSEGNHDLAVQIAALPDQIRGYEEIKLATVRTYHEKMAELQAEFAASASPTMVRWLNWPDARCLSRPLLPLPGHVSESPRSLPGSGPQFGAYRADGGDRRGNPR